MHQFTNLLFTGRQYDIYINSINDDSKDHILEFTLPISKHRWIFESKEKYERALKIFHPKHHFWAENHGMFLPTAMLHGEMICFDVTNDEWNPNGHVYSNFTVEEIAQTNRKKIHIESIDYGYVDFECSDIDIKNLKETIYRKDIHQWVSYEETFQNLDELLSKEPVMLPMHNIELKSDKPPF